MFSQQKFRKGALILFSEEIFSSNDKNDVSHSMLDDSKQMDDDDFSRETNMKTVNDLQRNVLYYGITPKDV